jgi:hypothetical protein
MLNIFGRSKQIKDLVVYCHFSNLAVITPAAPAVATVSYSENILQSSLLLKLHYILTQISNPIADTPGHRSLGF